MPPSASLTAAISAMMGRLWMAKATGWAWAAARLAAWPARPNPVTSVAAWAPNSCMRRAAVRFSRPMLSIARK